MRTQSCFASWWCLVSYCYMHLVVQCCARQSSSCPSYQWKAFTYPAAHPPANLGSQPPYVLSTRPSLLCPLVHALMFGYLQRFLSKAGDEVTILTTDDKEDAPDSHLDFPVITTAGFRFILYKQVRYRTPCQISKSLSYRRHTNIICLNIEDIVKINIDVQYRSRYQYQYQYRSHCQSQFRYQISQSFVSVSGQCQHRHGCIINVNVDWLFVSMSMSMPLPVSSINIIANIDIKVNMSILRISITRYLIQHNSSAVRRNVKCSARFACLFRATYYVYTKYKLFLFSGHGTKVYVSYCRTLYSYVLPYTTLQVCLQDVDAPSYQLSTMVAHAGCFIFC